MSFWELYLENSFVTHAERQFLSKKVLLQPSAAAERVFSLLSNSFKENQQNALEDYSSTSVMLCIIQNKRSHCCCMNIE